LRDPATPPQSLALAIRSLEAVGEGQAAERLREMVLAPRAAGPVRVEAAHALGALRADGLEDDAERLAGDASAHGIPARLAAVALLLRHRGDRAVRLLRRLTGDPESAVVAAAATRLLEIDPALLAPGVADLLASPDARVRSPGVEVLRRRPTGEHVRLLGDRLDDPDPDLRVRARRALEELAGVREFREEVLATTARVLGARPWRGQEQAALLAARLDHKPAAGRLVELLTSGRPEVFLSAAWALRRLDVPDTLPGVQTYVEAELGRALRHARLPGRSDADDEAIDHQLSQLNQFLGRRKYAPADEVLRRFIPRRAEPGPESRAAAIWALGRIHEGESVPALAGPLEVRLNDPASVPPEDFRVRWQSAVALGRLKARDALPTLRRFYPSGEPSSDPVANACGWAIAQITGKPMAAARSVRKMESGWFLYPADGGGQPRGGR
jgi:HEAT repeat protein